MSGKGKGASADDGSAEVPEKVKGDVVDTAPAAAQAEAEGTTDARVIDFAGGQWEIPALAEDIDVDAMAGIERASETGQLFAMLDGLEALFGKTQFRRLKAAVRHQHGGRFTGRQLEPLLELVAEAYGFDGGAGSGG